VRRLVHRAFDRVDRLNPLVLAVVRDVNLVRFARRNTVYQAIGSGCFDAVPCDVNLVGFAHGNSVYRIIGLLAVIAGRGVGRYLGATPGSASHR